MRLPSLRNAPKRPETDRPARPTLQVPRFVEDVYRDMRDRRLLLPALALIVAIVAVPLVLSADRQTPPAPLTAATPEGAEAVAPAVFAEEPIGVRDYRKRLDELESKNPFASGFTGSRRSPNSKSEGQPPEPTPVVQPPDPGPSAPPAPVEEPIVPAEAPAGGGGSKPPAVDDGNDGEVIVLAPRVDLVGGLFGKPREIEDVEIGDLAPSRRTAPIAMFIGVSGDLDAAVFAIANGVSETNGEGRCRPSRRSCEFLRMEDGDKQVFVYGPHERKYVLKLTDIREEIVDRRELETE